MSSEVTKTTIGDNENFKITRFVIEPKETEDKLKVIDKLTNSARSYAMNSGNSCNVFTDVTNPFHIIVEEQLN